MSRLQDRRAIGIGSSSPKRRLSPHHHHWSLLLLPRRWKSVKRIAASPIDDNLSTHRHLATSSERGIGLLRCDIKGIGSCRLLWLLEAERILLLLGLLLLLHHDILFLEVECHHLLHKHLLLLLNLHHLLLRLKLAWLWGVVHHLGGRSDSAGRTWVVHLEKVHILWSCLLGGG